MPLLKPASSGSGGEFNIAVGHFERLRTLAPGDPGRIGEICEVIRHCQLAISLNPRHGDPYVLLANALTAGSQELLCSKAPESHIEIVADWAAAAIERWRDLRGTYTKNRGTAQQLHEMLLRYVQQRQRRSTKQAEEYMTEQGAMFGAWVTAPASYGSIHDVLTQKADEQLADPQVTSVLFEKLSLELQKEGVFLDEPKRRLLHKWAGALEDDTELLWVEAFGPEMVRLLRRRYEAENRPEELWERYLIADFILTGHLSCLGYATLLAMGRDPRDASLIDRYAPWIERYGTERYGGT